MGVIQGSINNLLTVAAASARLSPGLEKKALEREYKKTEKFLEATDYEGYSHDIAKKQAERSMKIAESSPTEENIERYKADIASEEVMRPENLEAEQEYSRAKKAREQAKKDAEEALRVRQEEASNEFRRMFTEGGKYR